MTLRQCTTRLHGMRPPQARGMEGAASRGSEWLRQWAVPKSPPFGWSQVGGGRRGPLRARGGGDMAELGTRELGTLVSAAQCVLFAFL